MKEEPENVALSTGKRPTVGRILSVIVALAIIASPFAYRFVMDQKEPDPYRMRQYVVSNLSEEQIREIYEQSRIKFEKIKAKAKADGEEFWRKKAQSQKKCQTDIAFRTKNPGECSLPLTWQQIGHLPPGERSVEEIFERDIMGICIFAKTIRDAKKWKCLPE